MRKIVAAVGAILLLAGGAMLAVYLVSRDSAPGDVAAPPPPPLPPVAPEPAPAALPGPDLSRLSPPPAGGPAAPPAYGPPPPEAPPESWEAVPPVPRLGRLGPAGAALNVRLNELEPRIATCFQQASARGGRLAETDNLTETRDYGQIADSGVTVLMLQVETLAGALRIVDAPVEAQGSASPGAVACVQGVLRGQVVRAAGAKPGERYRILHTLTP